MVEFLIHNCANFEAFFDHALEKDVLQSMNADDNGQREISWKVCARIENVSPSADCIFKEERF